MSDKKFELSGNVLKVVIVFLVGLFVFWGFKVYESYWNTQGGNYPREISIDATGKAYVVPDTAKIYLGVYSQAETSEAVMEENTEKMNAVMEVLADLDISEEDIKTTNYSLYPNYQWTEDRGEYLDGYALDQNVEVKLTDFDLVGDLMGKVVEAGANVIGDVSFVVDDTEAAKGEARKDAIKKINEKVKSIEEASGLDLGKVLSYYEYEAYDYGKGYDDSMSYDSAYGTSSIAPVPVVEPGQEEVQLTVTLSYKIN
ncbi:MAG: SIMPL domain-containing protein [Nitrospirota bacterium]